MHWTKEFCFLCLFVWIWLSSSKPTLGSSYCPFMGQQNQHQLGACQKRKIQGLPPDLLNYSPQDYNPRNLYLKIFRGFYAQQVCRVRTSTHVTLCPQTHHTQQALDKLENEIKNHFLCVCGVHPFQTPSAVQWQVLIKSSFPLLFPISIDRCFIEFAWHTPQSTSQLWSDSCLPIAHSKPVPSAQPLLVPRRTLVNVNDNFGQGESAG